MKSALIPARFEFCEIPLKETSRPLNRLLSGRSTTRKDMTWT